MECPERQASDLILIWGPAGVLPKVETGRCRLYAGLRALLRQADAIFFPLASGSIFLPPLPLLCSRVPESPRAGDLYTRLVLGFTSSAMVLRLVPQLFAAAARGPLQMA